MPSKGRMKNLIARLEELDAEQRERLDRQVAEILSLRGSNNELEDIKADLLAALKGVMPPEEGEEEEEDSRRCPQCTSSLEATDEEKCPFCGLDLSDCQPEKSEAVETARKVIEKAEGERKD